MTHPSGAPAAPSMMTGRLRACGSFWMGVRGDVTEEPPRTK